MNKSRKNTPIGIQRTLRQEAGFGCAMCGNPFVEYHHIIEWSEREHFEPEHMIAICPSCHARFHRMNRQRQYELKQNPYNITSKYVRGLLEFKPDLMVICLGGVTIVNCSRVIGSNGIDLFSWRIEDDQCLITLRVFDPAGCLMLEIVDNEINFQFNNFWDFEFKFNWFRLKSKDHGQQVMVDLRKSPVSIHMTNYVGGQKITINSNGLYVQNSQYFFALVMSEVRNFQQYCFHFVTESFDPSSVPFLNRQSVYQFLIKS
jgi:HNH endonuclease